MRTPGSLAGASPKPSGAPPGQSVGKGSKNDAAASKQATSHCNAYSPPRGVQFSHVFLKKNAKMLKVPLGIRIFTRENETRLTPFHWVTNENGKSGGCGNQGKTMWRTNPMLLAAACLLAFFVWCLLPRHDEAFHLLESLHKESHVAHKPSRNRTTESTKVLSSFFFFLCSRGECFPAHE